jgi:hypothetical protein
MLVQGIHRCVNHMHVSSFKFQTMKANNETIKECAAPFPARSGASVA